jgi:hypothetical protein
VAKFLSKYVQDLVVAWINKSAFPAPPANFFVALLTTAPTDITGAGMVEVSTGGTAYARQALGGLGATSTGGSGTAETEQASQSGTITFPTPTANWGTAVGVALFDAASAGNLIAYGDLSAPQVINTGNVFSIPASNLTFQA